MDSHQTHYQFLPPQSNPKDLRSELRWALYRVAFIRLETREYPGMTSDISFGGMQLAVVGPKIPVGTEIHADVALDHGVVEMQGQVAYSLLRPWGCIVGLVCSESARGFLVRAFLPRLLPTLN